MTTYAGEIEGLPEEGPSTLPAVKKALGIADADTTEDDRLEISIASVNAQVRTWRTAYRSVDQETWWPPTIDGCDRLVCRLDGRRNSPLGVAAFATEGPAYVQLNDPDIAILLELGPAYSGIGLG